jgi:hypothetical protein
MNVNGQNWLGMLRKGCEKGMNLIVHLSITYHIYQEIKMKTKWELVLPAFLFGSILPDLDPRMSKIPHDIKSSQSLMRSVAKKITSRYLENRFSERISKSLLAGIFCHFISDYFCYAHNNLFSGNMYQHYMYELKMIYHIPKSKRYSIHLSALKSFDSKDVFVSLKQAQRLYLSDQIGYITDLAHAKNCASGMILRLVNTKKYCSQKAHQTDIN